VTKKIVVIGASAASIGFIAKLRSFDTQSQVVCFSGEKSIPYNRCFLADFVSHDKNLVDLQLKSEDFFQKNLVDLRLNSWVTAINCENKTVTVNGNEESYDYLFIGIGTKPFIPSIPGIDLPGVFGFHALADVEKLNNFIDENRPKTAIVIGAGINGIEAASSLIDRGIKVAVVDVHCHIMPLQVDQSTAHYIENLMKDAGIALYKGQKVTALQERNRPVVGRVVFESGASVPTDCVVLATGSRVNADLIKQAGLEMLQGSIVVNETMQTSDASIYAGGDVCITRDIISKEMVKSMTWSDAMLQGLTAATQFSENPRNYPGIVGMRDSKFFGYDFYACGQTTDTEMFDVIDNHKKEFSHRFYLSDGVLKGFVLVGNVENLAKYRTFYLTQQAVEKSDFQE